MPNRLGEWLVQEGVITKEQLDEALKLQVIYGGRLGTNLIEMGLVEEEEITQILSRKMGVPYVPPERLMNIPAETIRLIPQEIASKYKVIPLQREGKKLVLVLEDPSDLRAIEEIGFRTGFIIKPVLTPEVRLVLALEKYYQVERELRYVPLTKRVKVKRQAAASPSSPPAPQPAATETSAEEEILEASELEEISLEEVVEEARIEERPAPPADEEITPESISRRLVEAGDREDIADHVIAFLGHEFQRGALFLIKGNAILGWRAVAEGQHLVGFERLMIAAEEPSILQTVAETRSFYLGPIPDSVVNERILEVLGTRIPQRGLLVPLVLLGRPVGILYVDDRRSDLGERLPDLQKLCAKAAMAFEILILKNKILMT